LLAGQVLIYPVTDHAMETESYRLFGNGDYYLSVDQMTWSWQQYVPEVSQRNEPYASPLRGEDLTVDTLRYPGQIHGFVGLVGLFDDAEKALSILAGAIRTL
jgi:acetyl esterase/lipase